MWFKTIQYGLGLFLHLPKVGNRNSKRMQSYYEDWLIHVRHLEKYFVHRKYSVSDGYYYFIILCIIVSWILKTTLWFDNLLEGARELRNVVILAVTISYREKIQSKITVVFSQESFIIPATCHNTCDMMYCQEGKFNQALTPRVIEEVSHADQNIDPQHDWPWPLSLQHHTEDEPTQSGPRPQMNKNKCSQ